MAELSSLYEHSANDSLKIIYGLQIIDKLPSSDSATILYYYQSILHHISPNHYPKLTTDFYYEYANYLHHIQLHSKSKQLAEQSLQLAYRLPKTRENKLKIGAIRELIVKDCQNLNAILEAQILCNENLSLYDSLQDNVGKSRVNFQLAYIFLNRLQYEKAKFYVLASLNNFVESNPKNDKVGIQFLNLARIYVKQDSLKKAFQYIEITDRLIKNTPLSLEQRADLAYIRGEYLRKSGNVSAAVNSYLYGLELSEKYHQKFSYVNNLEGLADAYITQHKYADALNAMQRYRDYVNRTTFSLFNYKETALSKLSSIEERLGNIPMAYNYLKEYVDFSDSVATYELTQHIYHLEAQYQSVAQAKKINDLEYQHKQSELTMKIDRLILVIITTLFVLGLALAFAYYRNYVKQKVVNTQKEKLHQFELEKVKQSYHIDLLSAMVQASETESSRIGSELHDGLGGILSALKMNVESSIASADANEISHLKPLLADVNVAIREMRRISHSMVPHLIDAYGLAEALKQYCLKLNDRIKIDVQIIDYKSNISKKAELQIYRIAQELIHNVLKHAEASELLVQLQEDETAIYLTIEDNGKGFDTHKESEGIGLVNIKNRVQYIHGIVDFQSDSENGTSVYVTIPKSENETNKLTV